jgi:hypothetical protein
MNVLPMLKPLVPKNVGMTRCVLLLGFQTDAARPIRPSIRPIVTTSWATIGESVRNRMIPRSMSTPISGAATSTVSKIPTMVGSPMSTLNSQYTKARNMPMAPCAKLNTPDVA